MGEAPGKCCTGPGPFNDLSQRPGRAAESGCCEGCRKGAEGKALILGGPTSPRPAARTSIEDGAVRIAGQTIGACALPVEWENRNGVVVDACLTSADGHAERIAALHMIEPRADRPNAITLGADKAYDAEAEAPIPIQRIERLVVDVTGIDIAVSGEEHAKQAAAETIPLTTMELKAHWLTDYIAELIMFPAGRHDDQVDSTAQALAWTKIRPPSSGFLEYMRREAEEANGIRPKPMVRLHAPEGTSHVQGSTGRQYVVRDRIVEVESEDAPPLLRAGFQMKV